MKAPRGIGPKQDKSPHYCKHVFRCKQLEWQNVSGQLTLTAQKWHIGVISGSWLTVTLHWAGLASFRRCDNAGVTCSTGMNAKKIALDHFQVHIFLTAFTSSAYKEEMMTLFSSSLHLFLLHNSIFERWLCCVCMYENRLQGQCCTQPTCYEQGQ